MKIRIVYHYLLFLLFRDMDNHLATGKAKDMHQYLAEVHKGKLRKILEKAYDKMVK